MNVHQKSMVVMLVGYFTLGYASLNMQSNLSEKEVCLIVSNAN